MWPVLESSLYTIHGTPGGRNRATYIRYDCVLQNFDRHYNITRHTSSSNLQNRILWEYCFTVDYRSSTTNKHGESMQNGETWKSIQFHPKLVSFFYTKSTYKVSRTVIVRKVFIQFKITHLNTNVDFCICTITFPLSNSFWNPFLLFSRRPQYTTT